MYRKIMKDLTAWKNNKNKKALLITGARQIGKTYSIRELGKQYDSMVEINFITEPDAVKIFEGNLDADTIIMNLTAYARRKMTPHRTLVFFDEIQECPNARTAIKFLVEDGRFDYIESGSLLGVRYKTVKSYPVGYEETLRMYPMDFEEFCLANGLQEDVLSYLRSCYERQESVSQAVHQSMLNLFRYYTIVGGMPDVVKTFIESHDIGRVIQTQQNILSLYRQDISKYALENKARVTRVFDLIPAQLDDKNRRFTLSAISKNARSREYEDAFTWLDDAEVALPCYNLTAPQLPLKLNEKSTIFKLFLCDCGLLCAQSMDNIQFTILQGDLSVNMGSILENVFAQQLVSNGFELYYYNKQKIGELDFVLQKDQQVIPLEIKSGKDYHSHTALDNAMAVSEWELKQGIVFCSGNVEKQGPVTYFPWYMIMFYKRTPLPHSGQMIVNVDLPSLP